MTDSKLFQFFGVKSWPKLFVQALCKSFANIDDVIMQGLHQSPDYAANQLYMLEFFNLFNPTYYRFVVVEMNADGWKSPFRRILEES